MLHSTKLLNKVLISLMALFLLFNTNYGAFKTSEAYANTWTAAFDEWASSTYASVVIGTTAIASGAMHAEQYFNDNVDIMYQTVKESWAKMAPDIQANFLSSLDQMQNGLITAGDWIVSGLDALKGKFVGNTDINSIDIWSYNDSVFEYTVPNVTTLNFGFPSYPNDWENLKKIRIVADVSINRNPYSVKFSLHGWRFTYLDKESCTNCSANGPLKEGLAKYEQLKSINDTNSLAGFLQSLGFTVKVLNSGVLVPESSFNYNRLDEWIRDRAISNGQIKVYNPGANAYTQEGERLGLSSDGQTLLKLPDGIPWEGEYTWGKPLLDLVDGVPAILDSAIGSWINLKTGKKIRDATISDMASATGVDESTAEYVLIKAKEEEQAREEDVDTDIGDYVGKPYEGERNPDSDFKNGKGKSTLERHADKHGYVSSDKYLQNARNFLEKPPNSTTQSFVSKEGTYFRYDKATNEFGIINQYGGISTYFKPEDKIVYWLKQIELYAPK